MNVRAVVTEVLAIAMAAIFFINIFIGAPLETVGRMAVFLVFSVLAYFLIKGVLREATQREELHQKVAEQTQEIRHALESEKKARVELEKLNDAKDQFIMITQHHLRTPLTSVLWGLEALLKGEYGLLKNDMRSTLSDMQASGKRLMKIVDDFLNITAIKIGTNILNITSGSLKPSLDSTLAELKLEIKDKGVTVTIPDENEFWPPLLVDHDKIRESIFIILENAVRYNQFRGSVAISVYTENGIFELTVKNTGIGITKEESKKIGSSLFYRGEKARESHAIGMGIGLSVVKAIIKAHKGTFTIESKGKGEGAIVTVRLPIS